MSICIEKRAKNTYTWITDLLVNEKGIMPWETQTNTIRPMELSVIGNFHQQSLIGDWLRAHQYLDHMVTNSGKTKNHTQ